MFIPHKILEAKLLQLLAEDVGQGDVTAAAVVPANITAEAAVIAKEAGIAAGMEETVILVGSLGLKAKTAVADGEEVKSKQVLMRLTGDARTILSAERTLLNLVSRMSGIATATRKLVEELKKIKSSAKIAATRKTGLGLLYFDKKAVFIGGGDPHRLHLDDMILVKDNHIAIAGNVKKAVEAAKKNTSFTKKIEVEVPTAQGAVTAAKAGADIIMLDNFSPKQIRKAVESLKKAGFFGKVILEASGGINAKNLIDYALTGVNILSIGELTHSVKALDISLEVIKLTGRSEK
jgi:nicotinate-nucleotide pyrophosphorylase (carboxylating)